MLLRENVEEGNKDKVQKSINELGKEIADQPNMQGWPPFMLACKGNQTHIGECCFHAPV